METPDEIKHDIRVVVKNNTTQTTVASQNATPPPQPFNAGNPIIPSWYVQYQHELISENKMLKPDGFSSVLLENIGDDECIIFGGIPLTPQNKTREFLNRPGEVIATQIPIQFAKRSANRQVLVTKVYYERVK